MPGRFHSLAAAPALALACLAAGCSSTQTSLNAPTADKCQVGVSSAPSAFTATGGQGSLTITTARDCTWSISTEAGWVSISGDPGGQGEASVPYAIAPNPAPTPRAATVAVGSQSVTLNQAPAPCLFALSRAGDAIGYAGGRLTFDVTTLTGCGWTASTGDGWIAVTSGAERQRQRNRKSVGVAKHGSDPCRTCERCRSELHRHARHRRRRRRPRRIHPLRRLPRHRHPRRHQRRHRRRHRRLRRLRRCRLRRRRPPWGRKSISTGGSRTSPASAQVSGSRWTDSRSRPTRPPTSRNRTAAM